MERGCEFWGVLSAGCAGAAGGGHERPILAADRQQPRPPHPLGYALSARRQLHPAAPGQPPHSHPSNFFQYDSCPSVSNLQIKLPVGQDVRSERSQVQGARESMQGITLNSATTVADVELSGYQNRSPNQRQTCQVAPLWARHSLARFRSRVYVQIHG